MVDLEIRFTADDECIPPKHLLLSIPWLPPHIYRSLFSPSPRLWRMCLPASPSPRSRPPLLLGKTNLGQSLLLNEFYTDRLLPFPLHRRLQRTQPSPQPGTPPHSDCDWPTRLRLQHLWSLIGRGFSVALRLAGLQGVLFLWDGCRGAQEDLCAHREIPTNLSQAGRLPQHHNDASERKWSQSFPQPPNLFAPKANCLKEVFDT